MLPIVAIVGRENVGKSTLFNRLVRRRTAITYREPGVTVDRNMKEVELDGASVSLVDTGGYQPGESRGIKAKIREQVEISLVGADLILFVVDAKDGVTALDSEFAGFIRKTGKQVVLVVNKVDTRDKKSRVLEFHELGFEQVIPVSAAHGSGVSSLVASIKERIEITQPSLAKEAPVFAILGRPNVGKSTYINALLEENRVIADEKPGTTVDSIDVTITCSPQLLGEDKQGLNQNPRELRLVDTPGLRRRVKIEGDVEFYSSVRTSLSISKCDVAMLIVDASALLTRQDKRIISSIIEQGKGIVLVVNKIDLGIVFRQQDLEFADFIPITYISAMNRDRIYEPIAEAVRVWKARKKQVSKKEMGKLYETKSKLGISKMTQFDNEPPLFKIKSRQLLNPSQKRHLEKEIRLAFGFTGVPIRIRN
jgi:GTP-binding protein